MNGNTSSGYLERWAATLYARDRLVIERAPDTETMYAYVRQTMGFMGVTATEAAGIAALLRGLIHKNAPSMGTRSGDAPKGLGAPGLPFA